MTSESWSPIDSEVVRECNCSARASSNERQALKPRQNRVLSPAQAVWGRSKTQLREARQYVRNGDLTLHARKRRAQAVVPSFSERDMSIG